MTGLLARLGIKTEKLESARREVVDLNGDGKPDVAMANRNANTPSPMITGECAWRF